MSPQKEGDPPKISETIAPESFDIDLYQRTRNKDQNSTEGKYDLGWVLLPRENIHTLVFRFQHRYERFKAAGKGILSRFPSTTKLESKDIEKRFTIDLRKINYSPGALIELMYEPDPENQVEKIGKIYLREPDSGNPKEIAWEDVTFPAKIAVNQENGFFRGATFRVYASTPEKSPFREDGSYDPQFGRVLRERLTDSDLRTQLSARSMLVENSKRSFKFILDVLNTHPEVNEGGGLLISNLARTVLDIESAGTPAPRDIQLDLANAFAQLNDNQSSAKFFDRAGEKQEDSATLKFERGTVYYLVDNYQAAIRNLKDFLKGERPPTIQSLSHTMLALSYEKLGHVSHAIHHYKQAISLDPSSPLPYNGLAYLYAQRGENLQEALRLADRALTLDKDPDEVANYKDTKGWILYKMGRDEEALPLVKDAAARFPDNPEIREHLNAVQSKILSNPK